jgi:hypothetical protein
LRSLLRWSKREWRRGRRDERFGRFDLHALDLLAAAPTAHDFIQRATHVLDEVEPIGNLHGVRRTSATSIGIGAAAISDNDLHAGMGLQPLNQRVGITTGKDVDGLVAFDIDEHRGVARPPPQRKIVDTQHAWCRNRGLAQHSDQS